MQLVKLTKGKNIIMSADTHNKIYHRSPVDAIQMYYSFNSLIKIVE